MLGTPGGCLLGRFLRPLRMSRHRVGRVPVANAGCDTLNAARPARAWEGKGDHEMRRSAMARVRVGLVGVALAMTFGCGGDDGATEVTSPPDTEPAPTESAADPPSTVATSLPPTTLAPATTQAPTTTTEPEVTGPDVAGVFEDLFSGNISRMDRSLGQITPGSAAFWYARFQIDFESAKADAGFRSSEQSQVRKVDDGFDVCVRSDCARYSAVELSDEGLSRFEVDGFDITPRMGVAAEPVTIGPVTLSILTSYRTVSSDELVVNFEISTTEPIRVPVYSSSYTDPTGRSVSNSEYVGETELAASSRRLYSAVFSRSDPGGRFILEVYNEDFRTIANFDVVVPALVS